GLRARIQLERGVVRVGRGGTLTQRPARLAEKKRREIAQLPIRIRAARDLRELGGRALFVAGLREHVRASEARLDMHRVAREHVVELTACAGEGRADIGNIERETTRAFGPHRRLYPRTGEG